MSKVKTPDDCGDNKVVFRYDDPTFFVGYYAGGTWNGWDCVRVDKATFDQLKKICEEFSLPKNSFNQEIELLENLKSDGLIRIKNNKIKINLAAPQISRVVSSVFDKFFHLELLIVHPIFLMPSKIL